MNTLYMGAERYRTVDFVKAESIMSLLFLVLLVFGLAYLYR